MGSIEKLETHFRTTELIGPFVVLGDQQNSNAN